MVTTMYSEGLDATVPTELDDGRIVPAAVALTAGAPSRPMRDFARGVLAWVHANGGVDCDVVADYRMESDRPGGLMIRWAEGPTPEQVAAECGPIPSWVELRHDRVIDRRFLVRR